MFGWLVGWLFVGVGSYTIYASMGILKITRYLLGNGDVGLSGVIDMLKEKLMYPNFGSDVEGIGLFWATQLRGLDRLVHC